MQTIFYIPIHGEEGSENLQALLGKKVNSFMADEKVHRVNDISRVFFGGVLYFAIYMFLGCSPCCLICIPQIYGNLCLEWPFFPVLASWSQLNPFCVNADGPSEGCIWGSSVK